MSLPVVLEDEKKFLSPAEGKDGHQDFATAVEDTRDGFQESRFSFCSRRSIGYAKGRFCDHDIYLAHVLRDSGSDEMPVLFSGVVTCEEDVQAGNVDEEHGCAEDVAGRIGRYADARDGVRCVKIDRLDLREGVEVVLFVVEDIALVRSGGGIGHPDGILDEPSIDRLCGVGHEDAAFEGSFGKDERKGGNVVEMETEIASSAFWTWRCAARSGSGRTKSSNQSTEMVT